jgi:Family of unknown function (DUF6118)
MADTEHPDGNASDPGAGPPAAGDPATAFHALRAEVAELREAIEALRGELVDARGPDLTPTLAQFAKAQQIVAQHLGAIQQHPAVKLTPAEHGEAIRRAGDAVLGDAARGMTAEATRVRDYANDLGRVIGTARSKQQQLKVLLWTAGAAISAGLVLSPFIVRLLPFGIDENIAAFTLRADRWEAGSRLMQSANPAAWHELQSVADIVRVNHAAIAACREAAVKTGKSQHCAITVGTPE